MASRQKKNTGAPSGEHKLRIIGGKWRGRLLPFADVEGLRPTGSRVRETLFNWLMPEIAGSHCLDLFAGSGALGFEALSRGADTCTMIELNSIAHHQLCSNKTLLQCDNLKIIKGNASDFLECAPEHAMDIVFIDPPFAQNLWQPVLSTLQSRVWLKEGCQIYIEMPKSKQLVMPPNWKIHRQKTAGQVCYCLYHYEKPLTTG